MKRVLWVLPLAASAAAFACSSVSATQACTDLATAVCNKLENCASPLVTQIYGDAPTCTTRSEVSCNSSLALKTTADTPDLVEKCSVAYGTLACADIFQNNAPAACTPQTAGKLGSGATCGANGQCTSNVCQIDPTSGCGTCIDAVASGQPCKSTSDCQSGLVCSASTATVSVCVTPAASGGTCSTALPIVPCAFGLLCNAGKCQAPLPTGSACTPNASLCDTSKGDWCTPRGTRCTPVLFAGTGQPCGYDGTTGDLTVCSASGACQNISQTTGLGTCTAAAADNAACDVAKGPFCLPPAVCETGNGPDAGADAGTAGTCTVHDPSTCK